MNTKKQLLHEKNEFANIRELIEWAGRQYREKYAFSYRPNPHRSEIEKVTFRQFRSDVRALASEMISMGCVGKHCVVIGKFSYQWALTYYAILSIGAVLVPLDRDWLAKDLADTAEKADASFLFCDESRADKAAAIAERVKLEAPVIYLNAKTQENKS